MDDLPLYESRRSAKNLWQTYRVFEDRVELRTMFGRFQIPIEQIESVEILRPLIVSWPYRRFRDLLGIKLDWADMARHVVVRKKSGKLINFHFTPDNLEEFLDAVDSAMRGRRLLVARKYGATGTVISLEAQSGQN
jgi:hypothetical protein